LIIGTLKKMKTDVQNATNTPIHSPNQINDFSYYSRIINDLGSYNKINVVVL
jgi:hypothetical protein